MVKRDGKEGVEERSSQDVSVADDIWGMTDGEEAYGFKGGDLMLSSDIAATGDLGKAATMSI